jgi:kynureninase
MHYTSEKNFAEEADRKDLLKNFKDLFYFPVRNGKQQHYFTGNSLGLQPKSVRSFVELELKAWEEYAVEAHFEGKNPWFHYHKFTKKHLAELTGAKELEVVSMNNLTTNLHLMLTSFYQPKGRKNKIIIEAGAFPSDQYALETQIKLRGLIPDEILIELQPEPGEHCLRTDNILSAIRELNEELALVMMSGVQYYSGQFFEIDKITQAAHEVNAYAGFDLAHAIGNLPLSLHKDDVDFAVWCSYKYLNSGPGGVSGIYVNEKHGSNNTIPRLGGWWGQNEEIRFKMQKGFHPMKGADGWQLSNVNVISTAAHRASLEIFSKAGINTIREKSKILTGYLEYLLNDTMSGNYFEIITPSNPEERGAQLSLLFKKNGKEVFEALTKDNMLVDWREPNVVRISPVPLYNSFTDVFALGNSLRNILGQL